MIFNDGVLKKLMKEAYKGSGLLAGNKEGQVLIAGSWWAVGIDEDVFSNKAKAALIELTGIIPEQGELFRCTSEGNQFEMPGVVFDMLEMAGKIDYSKPLKKTNVLLEISGNPVRLYQSQHIPNVTVAVNDRIDKLLDGNPEVDESEDILGPVLKGDGDSIVFWHTGHCSLVVKSTEMISERSKHTGEYTEQEELFVNLSSLKL